MRATYRPRRILAVFAALALPAVTCGVAPALQDLLQRIELVEDRAGRLERFVANAHLPPVLMDEHNIVVGTVLEYNDLMAFASVPSPPGTSGEQAYTSGDLPRLMKFNRSFALATVQFTPPDEPPVLLTASLTRLMTPARGTRQETWFETTDCSGQPWIRRPFPGWSDTIWRYAWVGAPGSTLYTADSTAQEEVTVLQSRIQAGGMDVSACQPKSFPVPHLAVRMNPVADLSVFTPPFRLVDQRELSW